MDGCSIHKVRYRFIQINLIDTVMDLAVVYDQKSSTSLDFKVLAESVVEGTPSIFLFLDKAVTFQSPWVILLYIPEGLDDTTRQTYLEVGGVLRKELGREFSKEVHFEDHTGINWGNFQTATDKTQKTTGFGGGQRNRSTSSPTTTNVTNNNNNNDDKPSWVRDTSNEEYTYDKSKPWNERELKMHELNEMESRARGDLTNLSTTTDKPTGWRENALPLTSNAENALRSIKDGQVNWVQLTLINNFTEIDVVESKTVQSSNLSSNVDGSTTQFYLYDYQGSVVLIHHVAETGSVKDKMVYSTCKAPLSDTIKNCGISVVKKFEIRDPSELNPQKLQEETSRSSSSSFRVTNDMLRHQVDNSPQGRNVNPAPRNTPNHDTGQSSYRILTGGTGQGKKLPKGVVLPPPGAYN